VNSGKLAKLFSSVELDEDMISGESNVGVGAPHPPPPCNAMDPDARTPPPSLPTFFRHE
jgi:hypothetical protein